MQYINYYKKGKEFKTTVSYSPAKVSVKSVTDKFSATSLTLIGWASNCPYSILMVDSKTGQFYDRIEMEVETPNDKYFEYMNFVQGIWLWE